MKKSYIFAIALSTMIFYAMIGEGFGQQSSTVDVKLDKQGNDYGLLGHITINPWDTTAKIFAGVNARDYITGHPLDLRIKTDVDVMSTVYLGLDTTIHNVFGRRHAEGSLDANVNLYKQSSWLATLKNHYEWDILGNDIGPRTTLSVASSDPNLWAEFAASYDWKTHEKSLHLGISTPISSGYTLTLGGFFSFGVPHSPTIFTGTIDGTIITSQETPALTIVTSANYTIDEADPSLLILTGTEQIVSSLGVGGILVPVDKFALLTLLLASYVPYIGLASTITVAAVASAVYIKRVERRKEKQ
jgi:hypothetical protein